MPSPVAVQSSQPFVDLLADWRREMARNAEAGLIPVPTEDQVLRMFVFDVISDLLEDDDVADALDNPGWDFALSDWLDAYTFHVADPRA